MKFNRIRKAIEQASADRIRKHYEYIEKLTVGQALSDWFAETFFTPKSRAYLESCEPAEVLPIRISEQMKAKAERIEKSLMNKRLDKVAAAEAVELPEEIAITVDWVKSQTWGHNPHATVYAANTTTTGRASGAGYDKRSFAIAKAFNDNPEVMAIVYTAVEAGINPGYSVSGTDNLPFFDGGCGVDCFCKVFENCGYKFKKTADGRTFDGYSISKMPEITRTWQVFSPDNFEKIVFDWTKFEEFDPNKQAFRLEITPDKDGYIFVAITAKTPQICLNCLEAQKIDGLGECHTFNIIEEMEK